MYGKPAMTCFKYQDQVYLYGSDAITYLNALQSLRASYRQPSSPLYGSLTFTHLEENSSMVKLIPMLKSKAKTWMVEEASHAKQLSLNNVRKIGLKPMAQISQPFDYEHSNVPLLCWGFQNKFFIPSQSMRRPCGAVRTSELVWRALHTSHSFFCPLHNK